MTERLTRPMFGEFDQALRGFSFTQQIGSRYSKKNQARLENRRITTASALRLSQRFFLEDPEVLYPPIRPDVEPIRAPFEITSVNYNLKDEPTSILISIIDYGLVPSGWTEQESDHRNFDSVKKCIEDGVFSVQITSLKKTSKNELYIQLPDATVYIDPALLARDEPAISICHAPWATDEGERERDNKYLQNQASTAIAFLFAMNQSATKIKKRGYSSRVKTKHAKDLNRNMKFSYRLLDLSAVDRSSPSENSNVGGWKNREHVVRGFWRTLKSGKKTWVNAHKRGDATIGRVVKDYQNVPKKILEENLI